MPAELGVEIRLGTDVTSHHFDERQSHRRRDNAMETREPFDAVVSNCDAVRTHRELLGGVRKFERRRRYEPACSGVVLYLGLKRRQPQLLHHNFVFSRDPHEEFEFIYRKGEPAPDPTCYVCAPAATDPDVAPAGGEALYVLVHTPYLRPHHDWTRMLPAYRKTILDKLRRTAGIELADGYRDRERTHAARHPRALSRAERRDLRPRQSRSLDRCVQAEQPQPRSRGLYLCGGAAHPGPGMPMVLMSGWIAADALDDDLGSKSHADGNTARLATAR